MFTRHITVAAVILSIMFVSGCYTQLMTPQEFVSKQRQQTATIIADNSYSINYHQSCVTCHSVMELNERAEEMEYYGIRSVHNGYLLSSRDWIEQPITQPIYPQPSPNPYWPNPYTPAGAWWSPGGTDPAQNNSSGNRPRRDGATRDTNNERERSAQGSTPVYSQPQTPVGGTTTPNSTPPTTTTAAPASSQPVQTSDSEKKRDDSSSNSSTNRTRTDGASRDDNRSRPR